MPIFAVYRYEADTCGNEEWFGPIRYIQAGSKEEIEEVYPQGFLVGHTFREIEVETVAWIKIQKQIQETMDV